MIESTTQEEAAVATQESNKSTWKKVFLFINCILLVVGNSGSPLVMRIYFIHGGKRIWFSSFLQTAAFPLLFIPLAISYFRSSRRGTNRFFLMKPRIFLGSIIFGVLTGLDNYLYSYGLSRLPVSTQSLIIATQLAFTATFAFLLVKQKFTAFTINSIVLLCIGAAVLGLHANGDRPEGETRKEYSLGFAMTVMAALLAGFIFPFVEMTYKKGKQAVTYTLVLEIQLVMCIVATGFCAVGMIINKDFQAISREAKVFGLGEGKYYLLLVATALLVQCFFLSAIGVVFYASSLLSGIIISVSLPLTELLAVLFFHETFQAEKGVSLALSLWGFASYFYGEIKDNKKKQKNEQRIRKSQTQMVDQVMIQ